MSVEQPWLDRVFKLLLRFLKGRGDFSLYINMVHDIRVHYYSNLDFQYKKNQYLERWLSGYYVDSGDSGPGTPTSAEKGYMGHAEYSVLPPAGENMADGDMMGHGEWGPGNWNGNHRDWSMSTVLWDYIFMTSCSPNCFLANNNRRVWHSMWPNYSIYNFETRYSLRYAPINDKLMQCSMFRIHSNH